MWFYSTFLHFTFCNIAYIFYGITSGLQFRSYFSALHYVPLIWRGVLYYYYAYAFAMPIHGNPISYTLATFYADITFEI